MDHKITGNRTFDEARPPVFGFRVGGHKINQSPPPDWSEEEQAAFYARNYINVVWGETHGPPMSYEAWRRYGLGLKVELRFPPEGEAWMQRDENRGAVYHRTEENRRLVVSPFDPHGRQAYLNGFQKILQKNPDASVLYEIFGDYNVIPTEKSIRAYDDEPYPRTEAETIRENLEVMREAVGARDVLVAYWPWHSFYGRKELELQLMKEVAAAGFGIVYNEAGDHDNWILKRDNFNETALLKGDDGKTLFGYNYMSLVSAGGACESMNPVIAYPLPHVAAHKLRKLADIGARHFSLWWGSAEGWAYSANLSIIREMIWEPELFEPENPQPFDFEKGDPLLRRVAVRDFGEELASEILEFWRHPG